MPFFLFAVPRCSRHRVRHRRRREKFVPQGRHDRKTWRRRRRAVPPVPGARRSGAHGGFEPCQDAGKLLLFLHYHYWCFFLATGVLYNTTQPDFRACLCVCCVCVFASSELVLKEVKGRGIVCRGFALPCCAAECGFLGTAAAVCLSVFYEAKARFSLSRTRGGSQLVGQSPVCLRDC